MENSPDDTAQIRTRLVALRDELRHRVERIGRDLQHVGVEVPGDAPDRAAGMVNEPVLERIGSSAADELGQVETAIRHLDAGLYGRCTVCKGPIEPARLAAVPYAITCSRCA